MDSNECAGKLGDLKSTDASGSNGLNASGAKNTSLNFDVINVSSSIDNKNNNCISNLNDSLSTKVSKNFFIKYLYIIR